MATITALSAQSGSPLMPMASASQFLITAELGTKPMEIVFLAMLDTSLTKANVSETPTLSFLLRTLSVKPSMQAKSAYNAQIELSSMLMEFACQSVITAIPGMPLLDLA